MSWGKNARKKEQEEVLKHPMPVSFSTKQLDGRTYPVKIFPSKILSAVQRVASTARPGSNIRT